MMSTKTMSGWWSAILARASKPSMAVKTSQPSFARRVSAVRRMVLLSSMTSTLRPWSFELAPVTVTELLPPKAYGGLHERQAQRALTYRPTPCYARHVTFLAARIVGRCLRAPEWDIRCSDETSTGCRDGPDRQHQVRERLDARDVAGRT